MTNCPNCGAPITGDACEYCETIFREPNEILLYADDKVICKYVQDGVITINEARRHLGLKGV